MLRKRLSLWYNATKIVPMKKNNEPIEGVIMNPLLDVILHTWLIRDNTHLFIHLHWNIWNLEGKRICNFDFENNLKFSIILFFKKTILTFEHSICILDSWKKNKRKYKFEVKEIFYMRLWTPFTYFSFFI